ncbi:MAG: 2,3-bisphosphoglycerate-independent phosphoglycerate mutase [Candidatus Nanoarchaeia archaeon]|nr:2,3-bisphosphoglycerate-independent phosphoglycerate mutase [Candidatus Nanoarchaeia archaeon]
MKAILVIRDGWGYRKSKIKNAIISANPKFHDYLIKNYPNTLINASGEAVGLPKGFQGNSEVGHLTIGSGRIILQSMEKINKAINSGEFFKNAEFLKAINNAKKNNSTLHIMGLFQTEGVHSHLTHLKALIQMAKNNGIKNLLIHCFTDGRDAPVNNGIIHLKKIINILKNNNLGSIATITGRYYAMDRDHRWDRTKKAYDNIILGQGKEFSNPLNALKEEYKLKETDEFIKPMKMKGYEGVKENDSIIFFNYRTDRPRQLTKAIIEPGFKEFERDKKNIYFTAMTNYYESKYLNYAYPDIKPENILGQVISENGLSQLRISETEKYAHVTYFINGQIEEPFKGEDRILIPSPKIATYDLQPEMSAPLIAKELVKNIKEKNYDFIAVNLVNCDMVGHTGKTSAIIQGVKAVDDATNEIVNAGLEKDYAILIIADHGNAEDQTKKWKTSHTINPVPCILVSKKYNNVKLKKGKGLKDVAPTVLKLLGIELPKDMTGEPIF